MNMTLIFGSFIIGICGAVYLVQELTTWLT